MTTDPDPADRLVDASGDRIRRTDDRCPHCGAPPGDRVPSGGFGRQLHDVCGRCGWDFGVRRQVGRG